MTISKLQLEKPWAILGYSRKRYEALRLWKRAGVSREKFEDFLRLMPHEALKLIKDNADAEKLTAAIFGII